MGIKVMKAGWQSLVMDLGREDGRAFGMPKSGVMDTYRFRWANLLAGNRSRDGCWPPVIEVRSGNFSLKFEEKYLIGITGSEGDIFLDDRQIFPYQRYVVKPGEELSIRKLSRNGTIYLGIGGEWEVPEILGSRSADILTPLPGVAGRYIRQGDFLPVRSAFQTTTADSKEVDTPDRLIYRKSRFSSVLRLMRGPEYSRMPVDFGAMMEKTIFQISGDSNRMGYRLDSELTLTTDIAELISGIVLPGVIQWPQGQQPLLLMSNCQTTGGYPRVGKVIEADLWKLAYLGPGDRLQFRWSDLTEALYLMRYQEGQFLNACRDVFGYEQASDEI